MDAVKILKSTQEQALAAWIDYLNQLRLNELLAKLASQDINLEQALAELQKMKDNISDLITSNRGGTKGLHGFIAEAAETGIENARRLIKGLDANCKWINDNGPADLLRDGVEIQQKFAQAGGHFGLEMIKEHLERYPDFVKNGGKYQIPKDFYEEIKRLMELSQEEAAKESSSTYQLWKWVHKFFEEDKVIDLNNLEPSVLDYSEVQVGKIDETVEQEEENIKAEDKELRDKAYEESKPTLKQGAKAAAISAGLEGGMAFCLGVARKLRQGKRIHEFTAEDWKEVGIDTSKGAAKGGIRGAVVYSMTNFTATPAAAANALVTASIGITGQAYQLRQGKISAEDFIVNSEVLCLDVTVSTVASVLGQVLIPVPVLGAIIGNIVVMFLYQIAKNLLSEKEQKLIANYRESFTSLNKMLEERYQELVDQLKNEFAKFSSMLELAFDRNVNINIAFEGSVRLADYLGVPQYKLLHDKQDIDRYFTNKQEGN